MAAPTSGSPEAERQDDASIVARRSDVQALLGRPPLVHGEDEGTYSELLERVQSAVNPKDVFEEFWVRDIVDLSWEVIRLRRIKSNIMVVAMRRALEEILAPIVNADPLADPLDGMAMNFEDSRARKLATGWYRRDKEAVASVEETLRGADLSMDVVAALALSMSLNDLERVDRMATNGETRRNAVLREVARHRAAFAEDLRRSSLTVRDADFTEVHRT